MAKANQRAVLQLEEEPAFEQVEHVTPMTAPSGGWRNFARDNRAFIEMGIIWSLIAAVVLGLILLLVANLLAPDYFKALADLAHTFSSADLNSTIAEGISKTIGFLIPVGGILAFVAIPFAAFEVLRRSLSSAKGTKKSGY